MFDFNDVISTNNDSIINNIQQNLLDIRIAFFNCYKLFINVEKYNDEEYSINIVKEDKETNINYNEVITYGILKSLLNIEFKYIGISNINEGVEEVYISKYFKIRTIRNFKELYPSKALIKYNNSDDMQGLINIYDINDYNNALDDINRLGCLDIKTYNRFFDLLSNPLYKIGDNVLDPKFHIFYKTSINIKQKDPIFYMDKSNKKFYFIFPYKTLMNLSAWDIVEIIRCHAAYRFINNNLFNYESSNRSIYKMDGINKNISITLLSLNRNNVPEYILRIAGCYLKQSYIQPWVIIMVEPY